MIFFHTYTCTVLTQQEACSDMLLKFNFLESQLRITSNENKDLRKSLAVLQETLIYPDQLTSKIISSPCFNEFLNQYI